MNSTKDIIDKAKKLHELSEDFSLSHAVFATAKMIEDKKNFPYNSSDEEFLKNYKGNLKDLKQETIANERIKNSTQENVYISVSILSSESFAEGARTYLYERSALPFSYKNKEFREDELKTLSLSESEHFEIILPPKTGNERSLKYEGEKPSKKCFRFLIGHELGHLWLHLNEVRETVNKVEGTKLLPPELEEEANRFSFELSEHRDTRLLGIAEYIRKNKN